MKKNIYALKLAGLLKEQAGPPMGGEQGQMTAPQGGEQGMAPQGPEGGEQGAENPAALLDQAIELLNKVKESLGGAGQGQV
jgi:hypothetical protein